MEWIKILIAVAGVVLLTIVQNKINQSRHNRAAQVLMPVFSLLFALASTVLWVFCIDQFALPVKEDHVIYDSDILIVNLMTLLAFVLLKCIFCPLFSFLCGKKEILEKLVGGFYAYDDIYQKWFLLPKWEQFRKYAFAVQCALTAACGLFAGLTWAVDQHSAFRIPAVPVAALAVIGEMHAFLNGQSREEFEHTVSGDASQSHKISNFHKIRAVLETMLPRPLLTAQTGIEYFRTQSATDFIHHLSQSEDVTDQLIATYFNVGDRSKKADTDSIFATVQMMHRKSVMFFNPFFRDLETYIALPMMNALLQGKKCLVITGRLSNGNEVRTWIEELIIRYSHIQTLWRVDILSEKPTDAEIGVLCFPQLYDRKMTEINRSFFAQTDFVVMLEPSVIVGTGQIALSILSDELNSGDDTPVYCICDRMTDGLMDTLAHLLHVDLTDVAAPPVPRCIYAGLGWDADGDFLRDQLFDKQTKYLGNGTEIAAIAIKNQIPKVTWVGETKAPLRDLHWIVGQHYATVCRYMNQPTQQKALYDKIEFISHMWSCPKDKEQFIIAEDEFCNLFSALRTYLSRGTAQSFVNVLSENYLLRDYMCSNKQIFIANPNAIPSLTVDYAKTERNTLIKLLLQMSYRRVAEDEILHEFRLVGIEGTDAFDLLSEALQKYTFADNTIITVHSRALADNMTQDAYSIDKDVFDAHFADSLKTAYFILEEEKTEVEYLDSKMFSHVTQTVLPGQFVVYAGKYYSVSHISPQSGVVLRRASNLYDARQYYRQLRTYRFADSMKNPTVLSQKTVRDTQFTLLQADYSVYTDGYLILRSNNDLKTAKTVDLRTDPCVSNFVRKYRNKTVLRIQLPHADEALCFTLSALLSEMLRSIYADSHPYLAIVTPFDTDAPSRQLLYKTQGPAERGCIYIIEDSDIDLGLLESIEKNWEFFMEILTDYLDWHATAKQTPPQTDKTDRQDRFAAIITDLLGENADGDDDTNTPADTFAAPTQTYTDGENNTLTMQDAPVPVKPGEYVPSDPGDHPAHTATADNTVAEDEEGCNPPTATDSTDTTAGRTDTDSTDTTDTDADIMHVQVPAVDYLLFGFEEADAALQIEALQTYLHGEGFTGQMLSCARKRENSVLGQLMMGAVNHCDFCRQPLTGVSYEMLNDGRVRCNDCSATAITKVEEFRDLFTQVLKMLEAFFNLQLKVPVTVQTADARKIAQQTGSVFRPGKEVAGRVLGFAKKSRGKYKLLIENGSPRLATMMTMVHEITHIWQYINWNDREIRKVYDTGSAAGNKAARLLVYEGMAMWSSIQYLYQIGETYYATLQEALAAERKDIYGLGFLLYRNMYPLAKDGDMAVKTPFDSELPLDPAEVKEIIRAVMTAQAQQKEPDDQNGTDNAGNNAEL